MYDIVLLFIYLSIYLSVCLSTLNIFIFIHPEFKKKRLAADVSKKCTYMAQFAMSQYVLDKPGPEVIQNFFDAKLS